MGRIQRSQLILLVLVAVHLFRAGSVLVYKGFIDAICICVPGQGFRPSMLAEWLLAWPAY